MPQSDLYLAISSDGQMTGQQMLLELQEHRIAPVMTFQQDDKTILPLFKSKEMANKFAKRNTPKEYTIGTMLVGEKEAEQIKAKGWETEIWDFPKKRPIVVEVLELEREVETHNGGWKRHIK